MATSSRKLPRNGRGATSEASPDTLTQTTPASARNRPVQDRRVSRSPRSTPAHRATRTGSVAATIPAWEAVVSRRACPSKTKYRHGSHRAISIMNQVSESLIVRGRQSGKTRKKSRADRLMRANTITMGSKCWIAYLKATKALPHRSMAREREKMGSPGKTIISSPRSTHNSSIFEKTLA